MNTREYAEAEEAADQRARNRKRAWIAAKRGAAQIIKEALAVAAQEKETRHG
ncbi:hypothetical protein GGD63_006146 [Bradyrhizobium sp. cir1]|uniref:hypothetical protein n=1 Tax=Bradyrhizobium sp. cir1 TaxID=1445730 RepID=UPI0016062E68|nr:hypothetical protein [Bradyrhizobium sp. cir1]MBB4373324.1 hypothetical protein [Bradyrhizobium sp. cir1]